MSSEKSFQDVFGFTPTNNFPEIEKRAVESRLRELVVPIQTLEEEYNTALKTHQKNATTSNLTADQIVADLKNLEALKRSCDEMVNGWYEILRLASSKSFQLSEDFRGYYTQCEPQAVAS